MRPRQSPGRRLRTHPRTLAAAVALALALPQLALPQLALPQPALSQPARAQPASPATLLRQGAAAAAKGDHDACVKAYSAALALQRTHATAGELGLCEEALGRHVEAYGHLLYALEGEVPAAKPPAPAMWQRYTEAFKRVGRRIVRVLVLTNPNEAEVFVDGRSIGSFVSGRYFEVTPGEHTWTARLEGRGERTVVQTGRGGDFPDVNLTLEKPPPPAPPPTPPGPPPPSPTRPADPPQLPIQEPCPTAGGLLTSREVCALIAGIVQRMDPTLQLIGGGLLSLGLTADVGPGFFVGGSAVWRRKEDVGFHLGFEVQALMPTKGGTRLDGKPLDVAFATLAIVPCIRYKWGLGCLSIDGGLGIAGGPPPLYHPDGPFIPVLRLGPRLALDIPFMDRLGMRIFADLRISPIPPDTLGFAGPDGTPTWTHPTVSGLTGLGLYFQ